MEFTEDMFLDMITHLGDVLNEPESNDNNAHFEENTYDERSKVENNIRKRYNIPNDKDVDDFIAENNMNSWKEACDECNGTGYPRF